MYQKPPVPNGRGGADVSAPLINDDLQMNFLMACIPIAEVRKCTICMSRMLKIHR